MASVGVIFNSTYHTAQVIPWPTSPASNVVTYSQLADCPEEIEPFKDHLSTHGNLSSLRHKQPQLHSALVPP